jgi:Rps23 Pro-64 3,4-dihydroxylase Tpa1-like proline 4-hydroxylase
MIIEKVRTPGDLLVIKDVFTEKELSSMWNEIDYYYDRNFFYSPELTLSAKNDDGSLKKRNLSLFVDGLYNQESRSLSAILEFTEQRLLCAETKDAMEELNPFHGIFKNVNQHSTLLNYYENDDYYDFHADSAVYSILTFLFKEPKAFSGGELIFSIGGSELVIDVKSNMSVIFPSSYQHKVSQISMEKQDLGKVLGRFSIAQFAGIRIF